MSNAPINALDFSVVRELRKQSGLTLEGLSEKSGLSISVLSKLERNQNLMEMETLFKLARAFNLAASDLLSLAESASAHLKNAEEYESGPFHFEKVSYQGIDCFYATADEGQSLKHPEAHGDELEICWVRKGMVRVEFPHEQHVLAAGQSVKFDAVLEHSYHVLENSELVIIHLLKEQRF
ncbi:XRE family transcriptional regulator [Roseibacillus persicicus]|uniref:helix-turn-helix domain-containing protein n=1 Tax=Roseibacillus persicicus TaxID=454148 RepID=UPI00398B16A2